MGMSRGKGTQECLDIIKEYVSVDKIDFIQVFISTQITSYLIFLHRRVFCFIYYLNHKYDIVELLCGCVILFLV